MQSFMLFILHIPGRVNRVADFFSRSGAPLAFLGLLLGGFSPISLQNGILFYKNANKKNASSLNAISTVDPKSPGYVQSAGACFRGREKLRKR